MPWNTSGGWQSGTTIPAPPFIGGLTAGRLLRLDSSSILADGSLIDSGAGALKEPGATADAAPTVLNLIGAHAWPGATVNTTGAVLRLAPGIGRRIVTIVDFAQGALDTITVTVNGTATVLTEGTDFAAATSNNVTATNLATAINALAGVAASASAAVVLVTPDDTTYSVALATSDTNFATVTQGTNGAVNIGYGDLLAIGPTNVTLASGIFLVGSAGDVGVSRSGAGRLEVNSGSAASYRDLVVRTLATNTTGGFAAGFVLSSPDVIAWQSGAAVNDIFLHRQGAANLSQGDADAAAPVSQYLSVQNVATGTANTAGVPRYYDASQGTGTGAGGSHIWRVAPAGGAGSAQNALAAALTIDSTKLATFAGRIFGEGRVQATTDMVIGTSGNLVVFAKPSDGILQLLNDAGTGFSRFILGTNDTSGAALVKSGTDIQVKVGDASAYAALDAGSYKIGGSAFSNTNSAPGNPTGTTDTTGLMMGLAGAITPRTGKIVVVISGNGANNTINDGFKVRIRYGTGTAPANGAALTGTAVGTTAEGTNDIAANAKSPFTVVSVITGLTAGTAYWLDVQLAAVTGGTAAITEVNVAAWDIP